MCADMLRPHAANSYDGNVARKFFFRNTKENVVILNTDDFTAF